MERLKAELSAHLGESISRLECVSEQPYAILYALYDQQGHAIPLLAKSYTCRGFAHQEAHKLSLLMREGYVRLPTVYGIFSTEQTSYYDVMLMERLRGVSVEAPARNALRGQALHEQIIEAVLSWHRLDSHGVVGTVDNTQESTWASWYQQRIQLLWRVISDMRNTPLKLADRRLLYQSNDNAPQLFHDCNDSAVLVHGNLSLRSMLKDGRTDQLLAMLNPGIMMWAPREFELYRWCEQGAETELLSLYLQKAPVAEGFMARRWLYVIWELIARFIHTGYFDRQLFEHAARHLRPWLN